MYLADNQGVFFSKGNAKWQDWMNLGYYYFDKLSPYTGVPSGWYDGTTSLIRPAAKLYTCPSVTDKRCNNSYGYNTRGLVELLIKESRSKKPSVSMVVSDTRFSQGAIFDYNCYGTTIANLTYRAWSKDGDRHRGHNQVGFLDGHVASVRITTDGVPWAYQGL